MITGDGVPQSWSYQWSPRGFITSHGATGGGSWDIWKFAFADQKSTPLLSTTAVNEARGSVSPDAGVTRL